MSSDIDFSQYLRKSPEKGTSDEVDFSQYIRQPEKPKKSKLEKGARIAGQYALGAAESALLPYEAAVAPLASKQAQAIPYRENLFEDIERLQEQKQAGVWDEQDQQLYDSLIEQARDPQKSEQFIQTADLGVRNLAEKATGVDLKPQGVLEKAASWSGFIKNPAKLANLGKSGSTVKDIVKAISPTGKEALRGIGAGTALEMAEEGEWGPIGTMAAAIVGDVVGGGASGVLKGLAKPKQTISKAFAKMTPKDKLSLQKDLIKDFKESGIQADIGTLTNSNLLKFMQSRLAQSGLTGKSLDRLRENMTSQIKKEYKAVADSLGEATFATQHEAGSIVKESLKKVRDADLAEARSLYEGARTALKEQSFVNPQKLFDAVKKVESDLRPGAIKSVEQKSVLEKLNELKRDISDSQGRMMFADVRDLINNKIALNDIINYEVQGGTKQLLKGLVAELDRAIISHGKENPAFARNYINANKKFANHARTFRGKSMSQLLNAEDPMAIINKMNSVQGIKDIGNALSKSPQGKETFNSLKRLKFDKMMEDNLIDSTTQQIKLGTFSKVLEKGKNKEIAKELLGTSAFNRLEKLQKNTGKLADTAQKFYNASKSGVVVEDMAVVATALKDIANLFAGNPFPAAKTAGGIAGALYINKLISNPEFLKMVEETILASEKGNSQLMYQFGERLIEPVKAALQQTTSQTE